MHYLVEPEVAGEMGEGTIQDRSTHPPRVDHLVYEVKGWLGDDIMTTFPCFVVTSRLGAKLRHSRLGVFEFRDVQVTMSPEGEETLSIMGFGSFPECERLHITGAPGQDDFGVTSFAGDLVVSERGLDVLRQARLERAHVEEYDPAVHK